LESLENIRPANPSSETIDLGKLLVILRTNWIWIALIFIVINSAAYLFVRYTKNVYRSDSEIKLDIKRDASEFGINKNLTEEPDVNIVSGEIEILQSRLFLNRVLDQSDFEISFISVGRVLNDEMFRNVPAYIHVFNNKHSYFDTPIHFKETDARHFVISAPLVKQELTATYGESIQLGDLQIRVDRNDEFKKGDEVGYYFVINSREMLLDYLVRNLIAEPMNYNANTIRVAFKDHNPFKAQAVLNKIDTTYLHYSNEQKNLANKQKIDWLSNELKQIELRMEAYENYFESFTLENKTNDLDGDLKETITAINRVDSQRYEYTRRLKEIDRLLTGLESGRFIIPVWMRMSLPPVVISNIEELTKLQLEQEKLKFSHNEVTLAFRQKQQQKDLLKAKTIEQINEVKQDWARRLQELQERKQVLEKEFTDYPEKNTQFTKNQRFYKLYEEFYLTLMQSKSQFEIAQAGTTPDFKILSPATLGTQPISPNRIMIGGIGMVASLVSIFLFVSLLYFFNNKITNLSELDRVRSAPVLGAVPVSRYSDSSGFHVLNYPKSMVSEAIRSLRTNLDFFNISSAQKVIAISSTVSGEGKSFIALNLGAVLAMSKKRVVLVDLDMRKPKSDHPLYSNNSKGVSTVLIRRHTWAECLLSTALENFDFIPSGPHPPNPSELLLNGEFEELINTLKESYDYIILDTPPVGLVTDGIMAMRKADLSIYVFRANYSKRDFIQNLQRVINLNKFSNITTLLNALPSSSKTYGYGYYEEQSNPKDKLRSLLNV
jgi:tyrosine-protein kinase Etk/Wzc